MPVSGKTFCKVSKKEKTILDTLLKQYDKDNL
jgi:hypothetical protein